MVKGNVQVPQNFRLVGSMKELDIVNCARLRRPYGGLGGSV